MIRNCENEKYAHSITNASVRLPRSWKCAGLRDRRQGLACPDSIDSTMIARQKADMPSPSDDDETEDGRIPVRVERHQPVDGGEADQDDVDQQARAR